MALVIWYAKPLPYRLMAAAIARLPRQRRWPAAGWLMGRAIHNLLFYLDKLPLSNTLIFDNKLFYCYT